MRSDHQLKIRLPDDLKAFVADQAERYSSSQTSEIVRAVRERMERTLAMKSAPSSGATLPEASPEA